jgi:exopolysaccharide production protein ExoZ
MPFISHTVAGGGIVDIRQLIASVLFLPYPYPADPAHYYPVYVPGWTINYEMFFYLVFSLGLIAPRKELRLPLIGGFLLALVAFGQLFRPQGAFALYTSPILLEFLYGVVIAVCFEAKSVLPNRTAFIALVAGTILLLSTHTVGDTLRPFVWGLPAAMAIVGFVSLERNGTVAIIHPLLLLGDASYSIYLTHLFTVGLVSLAWTKFGLPFDGPWAISFIIIAFIGSAVVGLVTYFTVEDPLLNVLRSKLGFYLSPRYANKRSA